MLKTNGSESKTLCPECGSESICKSRRRGILERVVLGFRKMRPYRCRECYERFYAQDSEIVSASDGRNEETAGAESDRIKTLTAHPRAH